MSAHDLLQEELVRFADAKRTLKLAPTREVMCRYRRQGIRVGHGPEAVTVKLEAHYTPNGYVTSVQAWHRFLKKLDVARRHIFGEPVEELRSA